MFVNSSIRKLLVATFVSVIATTSSLSQVARYEITEIPLLPGGDVSWAHDINNNGQVAGFGAIINFTQQRAFRWENGQTTQFEPFHPNGHSLAFSINQAGLMSGIAEDFIGFGYFEIGTYFLPDGTILDNDFLGSTLDVNNIEHGAARGREPEDTGHWQLTLWQATDEFEHLGTLGGWNSVGNAINDNDHVAGWAHTKNNERHAILFVEQPPMTDLGTLGGNWSEANDINNSDQIVGGAETAEGVRHAFLCENETMIDLGTLGGHTSIAYAINQQGDIVGSSWDAIGNLRAFLYQSGEMIDLNDEITEDTGWILQRATGLNDVGQIVGWGRFNGEPRSFVLTPTVSSATLIDIEVVTGVLLNGTVAELETSDDLYVHTLSGFGQTLVDLHNMEMIVNAVATLDSATTIDLTIESRIDEPAGLAQIRLRNWNTNQFESVGSYSINNTDQIETIDNIDATNYIDTSGGGNIDLSIKHLVFVPFLAFTFESFIDHVEIVVN